MLMIGCIKMCLIAHRARSPNFGCNMFRFESDTDLLATLDNMNGQLVQRRPVGFGHDQLRDIWAHACFLVQVAYDLDWAVAQFETLERRAPNCLIKAILLLNIGITWSLQAEYRHAEQAFKKVLPLHPFMAPLAHYLLGVARFELSEYEQAQISFKLCAYILKQTDCNRTYHSLGLNFTLSHHLVVENEEIAAYEWTLKQKGRYGFRLLHRIPASLVFGTAVLNSPIGYCCDRTAKQPHSAVASSISSVYSEDASSSTDIINHTVSESVQDVATRTLPMIPRQPLKKSMIPRAAQTEASNIRSLTHFLKYTGPEELQLTHAEEATNTSFLENNSSMSARRTGSVRQVLSQAADQADNVHQIFRKVSTLTLKKYVSMR